MVRLEKEKVKQNSSDYTAKNEFRRSYCLLHRGKFLGINQNGSDNVKVECPFCGVMRHLQVRWQSARVDHYIGSAFPFRATAGLGYVWHCHIIDHEDNEMMRPLIIKKLLFFPFKKSLPTEMWSPTCATKTFLTADCTDDTWLGSDLAMVALWGFGETRRIWSRVVRFY